MKFKSLFSIVASRSPVVWKHMNSRQRNLLLRPFPVLWTLFLTEWRNVLLWSFLGAAFSIIAHLVLLDHAFHAFVGSLYKTHAGTFDGPKPYLPHAIALFIIGMIAIGVGSSILTCRGLKSWLTAVTSGLSLVSFTSMFLCLLFASGSLVRKLTIDLEVLATLTIVAFLLALIAQIRLRADLREEDLRVPKVARVSGTSEQFESDNPIQSWAEDALGRAALVDGITAKILISKTPVLGIVGEFGSGKTSILNLLRLHLNQKAIVVTFSTWLPGSQETLAAYLLADIANECRKHYVVPGLQKSTYRIARALGKSVPVLKDLVDIFPAATQRDDIETMRVALLRLPRRVVLLLDDLDRMERDELITLLKVVRGISTLPNLTFVCALDLDAAIRVARNKPTSDTLTDYDRKYFQKFFPDIIQVPKVGSSELENAAVERLISVFRNIDWFPNAAEEQAYRKKLSSTWETIFHPVCSNLRSIGLLANSVSNVASLLRREVDAFDLTLLELLHRFVPDAYDLVGRNSLALTGGEGLSRGGEFLLEEDKKKHAAQFSKELQAITGTGSDSHLLAIIRELFPDFTGTSRRNIVWTGGEEYSRDKDLRISNPSIFPAYFRYELPQAVFSSVELDAFLTRIKQAADERSMQSVFLEELTSMEKGSLKRTDFLRKLSEAASLLPSPQQKCLVQIVIRASDKYAYDIFYGSAEAGQALKLVLRTAEKLSPSSRVDFLCDCIAEANDDSMALRILIGLSGPESDADLGVPFEALYPAFAHRMRARYATENVESVDLATVDPAAFRLWGSPTTVAPQMAMNADDKEMQRQLWLRYIGKSKTRLADVSSQIFLPRGIYREDPTPFVESMIPVKDLKQLAENATEDGELTTSQQASLEWIQRFLNGEFKNGISGSLLESARSEPASSAS